MNPFPTCQICASPPEPENRFAFERFPAWSHAVALGSRVFEATRWSSAPEQAGWVSELRSTAVSLTSQLAVALDRGGDLASPDPFTIAAQSLTRIVAQVWFGRQQAWMDEAAGEDLLEQIDHLAGLMDEHRERSTRQRDNADGRWM